MKRKPSKNGKPRELTDARLSAICRLLLDATREAKVDPTLVTEAFGDVDLPTIARVAAMFRISCNTVHTSWRTNGCPGEKGSYPLADVMQWLLLRELKNSKRAESVVNPRKQERADAECRQEVAKAKLLELKLSRDTDLEEFSDEIKSQLRAALIVFREGLLSIPAKIRPFLPREQASDIAARVRNIIRLNLEGLATKSEAELLQLKNDAMGRM